MSERDVLELIDRAAHEAPTMHVDADQVLAGGRRKVRRRATSVAGVTVGGLALAGAAWLGLGGDGLLGGASEIVPAQTTWEVTQDERVPLGPEGEVLFSGGTRVGDLVLVARPDGSSRLEGSVDGRAVSADGQDAVGGRAVAYDLGPVSVLLHPAVDVPVTLVLGDARESQGHGPAQVGGSSVDHQIMVGRRGRCRRCALPGARHRHDPERPGRPAGPPDGGAAGPERARPGPLGRPARRGHRGAARPR